MNNTGLVILREYLQRVRKGTFILLTLLGPVLYMLIIAAPILISQFMDDERSVQVVDETGLFDDAFANTGDYHFEKSDLNSSEAEEKVQEGKKTGTFFLIIPAMDIHDPPTVRLIGDQSPGTQLESNIQAQLDNHIEKLRLRDHGLEEDFIASLRTSINLDTQVRTEEGFEAAGTGVASMAGFVSAILIYFFLFAYGGMVMQGVQEEKSSRIVEIIVSSVKPFQLMLGKIAGVALVGITQLILWLILTFVLLVGAGLAIAFIAPEIMQMPEEGSAGMAMTMEGNPLLQQSFDTLGQINFPLLFGSFLFYFLGGYLLYASIFAAIGASVENQNDSQQFMMPVMVPIFFGLLAIFPISENPGGSFAFWVSMIPFTSPIAMITRIPFGVPAWELLLSMSILVVTFIFVTWLAGRIYHTGILLYGSKPTFKQLVTWVWKG